MCSAERALLKPPSRALNNNNWKIEYNIICTQDSRSSIANRGMLVCRWNYIIIITLYLYGKKSRGKKGKSITSTIHSITYYNDPTWMAPYNVYYAYTIVCLSLHSLRRNTQWFGFFFQIILFSLFVGEIIPRSRARFWQTLIIDTYILLYVPTSYIV